MLGLRLAAALGGKFAAVGRALAALSRGALGVEAAQVIVRAVRDLPAAVPEETRREGEAFLLEQAAHLTPTELARLGRRLLHVLDPDAGDMLARAEASDAERNELSIVEQFNGRVRVVGDLDAEAGAALRTALDPLAAPRPAGSGGPAGLDGRDTRTARSRLADALVELVHGVLAGGGLPTSGGERPHLSVTVDLATLQRRLGARAGESTWGAPLPAEAVRRLARDAKVIPMLLGGASQPLGVGRVVYAVPPAVRRALEARDRGCAFPGCGRPPAWCHAHHLVHWADGGQTSLRNTVLLCAHHHRVVQAQGWAVRIGPDGLLVFTPPRWTDPGQLPIRTPRRAQLQALATRAHDPPDPGTMSA